jgi:hypothetical protein
MINVQPNPYQSSGWSSDYAWSVQIPHDISGYELQHMLDGDQPAYSRAFTGALENMLQAAGVQFRSVADYPKDGNTLRYLFLTESAAKLAAELVEHLGDNQ